MNRITKLIPHSNLLVARKTVFIETEHTTLEIPICSEGVLELREQLVRMKPMAPKKPLLIRANSDEGKELNLNEDTIKLVIDEADELYNQALAEFNTEFVWRMVVQGIDMDFLDKNGNKLEEFEDKKAVLLLNGITIAQLESLFKEIIELGNAHVKELGDYVKESVGITKEIERKIISRSKKSNNTHNSALYNKVILMHEYSLNPSEIEDLSDADKAAMNYSMMLKYHNEAEAMERMKKEQEMEARKQKAVSGMPTFSGGR